MARKEPYVNVKEVIKDTPTRLSVDGSTNIGVTIVAPVGPKLAFIDSPSAFLKNYTVDGVTIPRDADITFINAYYLSFFAGLVVSRSMNSDAVGGLIIRKSGDQLVGVPALYKDDILLSKVSTMQIEIQDPTDDETDTNWGFILDDLLYWHGDYETVINSMAGNYEGNEIYVDFAALDNVEILYDEPSERYTSLAAAINKRGSYTAVVDAGLIKLYHDNYTKPVLNKIETADPDTGEIVVATTNNPGIVSVTIATSDAFDKPETGEIDLFLIKCKVAQEYEVGNVYSVKIGKTRMFKGRRVFNISFSDSSVNRGEWMEYMVSLDKNAVDSSDVSCYIDTLNQIDSLAYNIEVLIDDRTAKSLEFEEMTSIDFGASLFSSEQSAMPDYMIAALDALEDQEMYRIAYMAPCGLTNVRFLRNYCSMGERNKWFCPMDVPYDRINVNSIKQYVRNLPDNYNNFVCGPFDKNVGLLGWTCYIAATTLYWERVFINRSQNSEFAPVFDAIQGLMAYTNPVKLLTKSDRTQLINLALPVNYAIYDMATDSFYLNDNWTHYSNNENVVGEENNVRLAHRISNDLEQLYRQFKAKHNTEKTRQDVKDLTKLYFSTNIMNQNFKPAEYLCICDESNNTDDVINARKLAITVKIRLFNSIKYIEVINEIYSVGGQAFTE